VVLLHRVRAVAAVPRDRSDRGSVDEGDPAWLALPSTVRNSLAGMAGGAVLLVLLTSAYFYGVWTGALIPYQEWLSRMWLQCWI